MNDDYDHVTAADMVEFTHHLADMRQRQPRADDPVERALFLARKADLLIRIAAQHTRTDPEYAEQVLQLAHDAQRPEHRSAPALSRTVKGLRPASGALRGPSRRRP